VRVLPLISGRIEISEIVVEKPVINLERLPDGSGNWTFRNEGTSGFTTRFSGIHISDGTISYRGWDGRERRLEHADLTIGLTSTDKPVTLDGEALYRKRRVALEARLQNLLPMGAHDTRKVDLSLSGDLLQGSFKGDVSLEGDATGTLKLDTTNISGVADWLGENLPQHAGLKALSLEGRLESQGKAFSFPDGTLRLDNMTITGHFAVDLAGTRPNITGDVVVDRLDLNRYLDGGAAAPKGGGWSNVPIDLSLLHLFDGTLAIDTGALRIRSLHLSKTHLNATLAAGVLNVTINPMSLYGGSGTAHLAVDTTGPVPSYRNELSVSGFSMRALLLDAVGAQRIAGRGTLSLAVTSEGGNPDSIIRNLAGRGSLVVVNGEITGVDLPAIARAIKTVLTMQSQSASGATPFDRLSASFAIAHGVLATRDFRLDSKGIKATGIGTVDLPDRTLDFVVKPKAVLLPIGTGFGVSVPFRAHGPWTAIVFTADVGGAVTSLVGDVFHSALSVPGAVGDLLSGGNDKQKPKSKPKKSKGFFDGLFGH